MPIPRSELRHRRVDVCGSCGACGSRSRCAEARQKLRSYSGIRFTSDEFDCALPVAIDSHSLCSYGCLYCFSDNTIQRREQRFRNIGQTPLSAVERLFAGKGAEDAYAPFRKALKYDRLNRDGYPCPVQLGALNDPCDHIERNQGWLIKFIELAIKYRQPVRISTKGSVFQFDDYLDAVAEAPHLFWVAVSITTPDDAILEKIDRRAPNATERLETMRKLSSIGVKTSLRFRPMFPRVSDKTPEYPRAYETLIERAANAGAVAVSCEVGFVPGAQEKNIKRRWERFSQITGVPFIKLYKSFGDATACMRPPAVWTENIMHAVYEVAHGNGLVVGVSDPVWKQLTDTGCCCGILPNDPVFGNWEEESATNQLLLAKRGEKQVIGAEDIVPEWADDVMNARLVFPGAGPKVMWERKHLTCGDDLRELWNQPSCQRSPLKYFQGALMPSYRDNGNLFYEYSGLEREYPAEVPYWEVPPGHGQNAKPLTEYANT